MAIERRSAVPRGNFKVINIDSIVPMNNRTEGKATGELHSASRESFKRNIWAVGTITHGALGTTTLYAAVCKTQLVIVPRSLQRVFCRWEFP